MQAFSTDNKLKRKKMKIKKQLNLLLILIVLTSCEPTTSEYIKVYEDGIEKTKTAHTKKKLHKITYEVQDDIINLQNRIGRHNISKQDQIKIFDAQNKFYDAVEKRDKELSK